MTLTSFIPSGASQVERMQSGENYARYTGSPVRTPWSSQVFVEEILCSADMQNRTFYGVILRNRECFGAEWLASKTLHWVFDDGNGLRLWEQAEQRPLFLQDDAFPSLEDILCFLQWKGRVYLAVKWREYGCPTWELEETLSSYSEFSTNNRLTGLKCAGLVA